MKRDFFTTNYVLCFTQTVKISLISVVYKPFLQGFLSFSALFSCSSRAGIVQAADEITKESFEFAFSRDTLKQRNLEKHLRRRFVFQQAQYKLSAWFMYQLCAQIIFGLCSVDTSESLTLFILC